MKRSLLLAGVVSFIVNAAGFLTNLIAYHSVGRLIFYKELWGGEWVGYYGFGILMNRTFPLTVAGDPNANGRTWLSFDPKSLLLSVAAVFLIMFVILLLIRVVKARISRKNVRRTMMEKAMQ